MLRIAFALVVTFLAAPPAIAGGVDAPLLPPDDPLDAVCDGGPCVDQCPPLLEGEEADGSWSRTCVGAPGCRGIYSESGETYHGRRYPTFVRCIGYHDGSQRDCLGEYSWNGGRYAETCVAGSRGCAIVQRSWSPSEGYRELCIGTGSQE